MLSLQLKSGEYLTIGDDIAVQIFEQSGSAFRVAVKAPREVPILRGEVHERGADRPDGLRGSRPKSPSEYRHDAKRFEQWAAKKEVREDRRRAAEAEKAAIVRDLTELADNLNDLVAAHGNAEVQNRLKALGTRLSGIAFAE